MPCARSAATLQTSPQRWRDKVGGETVATGLLNDAQQYYMGSSPNQGPIFDTPKY